MVGPGPRSAKFGWVGLLVAFGIAAAWWLWPRSPANSPDGGRAAYERGDYRAARALALARLTRAPEDPSATKILARASARIGNDDAAQSLYGQLGERSMEAEDFFVLGSSLERGGRSAQALAVLERARTLEPGHPETLEALARFYARSGRLADAIDAAGRLAERPGWEARGSLILGVLDVEDADPEGAVPALERALRVDPKLLGGIAWPDKARKLLAGALLRSGRPAPALEALGPLLGRGGVDPEAAWLSGRAWLQSKDLPRAGEALALAGDFGKDDPTRPEPAAYAGAEACAGCHAAIYRAQRASRHSRTFSDPADLKRLALPDRPIADPALSGTSHAIAREGDAIRLTTRSGTREFRAVVEFAVGSGDRGMTMVARDGTGLARVCRVSSYQNGATWDLTSHATVPHPDDANGPLGRPMSRSATEACAACHVTSLRAARDRRAPEAADRGIGCERCHGPGGNHLAAMDLHFADPAIARPSKASADQITRLCGACHKADDPSTTEADPRFVRFQATTLPMSRCYTESLGALSCVTCHDPHRDAATDVASYENRCLACHGTPSGRADSRRGPILAPEMRRVACPVNPASGCVACHMPKVEGAAPHASFADHQIRARPSPRAGR